MEHSGPTKLSRAPEAGISCAERQGEEGVVQREGLRRTCTGPCTSEDGRRAEDGLGGVIQGLQDSSYYGAESGAENGTEMLEVK